MPIFKSNCRLEQKLWHFEHFIFFWKWKCSKRKIPTNVGLTINHFALIWSTIYSSFIEICPLAAKIWPKHHTWGSESPMWPLTKKLKLLILSTMKIHFDEEGECFAPLPSLWRVPQVPEVIRGWDPHDFRRSFAWRSRFFRGGTGKVHPAAPIGDFLGSSWQKTWKWT